MRANFAFLLCLGLVSAATNAQALDDPTKPKLCEPNHAYARQTPPGGYDFKTGSWMRSFNNAFAYHACVENDETGRDLFVDWHIPTVQGIIPKLDSITKPRVFPDHPTVTVLGCLIYGNNRKVMKVDFLGHKDEGPLAQQEGNCEALRPQPRASGGSLSGVPEFGADGRMVFPTNIDNVANTLVRLVYEIGMKGGGDFYTIWLSYAAAPLDPDRFKGNMKDLRIIPSEKRLLSAWEKQGYTSPLTDNRNIYQLTLPLPQKYAMEQQSYMIIDPRGQVLGEIPAPFLAEANQ